MYKACNIIAEVGQSHDGSLGIAHSYIEAISKTGANGVKFQTHIAQAETTPHEPWRVKFSTQDKTRYDYWKRMEFTETQWHELKAHALEKDLLFYSSAFSIEAIELLKRVGVDGWKIASGEINNQEMFDSIAETKLPVYLSTGMSPISEIDKNVEYITKKDLPLTILQCTSMYPTPVDKIGLNIIDFFRSRYSRPVGLSDHSGKIFPGLAAISKGIEILEIHVTHSKELFGPDVSSSITLEELKILNEGVRYIEQMEKHDVDKDEMAAQLQNMRDLFTKSIIYKDDLQAGTILKRKHLCFKKPGLGIHPSRVSEALGRRLVNSVKKDSLLSLKDLND